MALAFASTAGCLIDNPLYGGVAQSGTDVGGVATTGGTSGRGPDSRTNGAGAGVGSGATSSPDADATTDEPGPFSTTSTSDPAATETSSGSTTGDAMEPFCDATDPDLIACYEFDDDVGVGMLEDGSSYGHDGVVLDAGAVPGVRGMALSTEEDSEVRVWNTAQLQLVAEFSVELWIYPRDVFAGEFQHIVDKDRHYTTGIATNGHLRCRTPNGLIEAPFPVAEGAWSHLACVFDGDTLTMYVNGSVAVAEPMQPEVPSNDFDLMLGSAPDGDWPYDGLVDDLRIWSRPLSADEICDAYGGC